MKKIIIVATLVGISSNIWAGTFPPPVTLYSDINITNNSNSILNVSAIAKDGSIIATPPRPRLLPNQDTTAMAEGNSTSLPQIEVTVTSTNGKCIVDRRMGNQATLQKQSGSIKCGITTGGLNVS